MATSSFQPPYYSSNSPLGYNYYTNQSKHNKMPSYKLIDPNNNGAVTSIFGNTKFIPNPSGVDKTKGTPQSGSYGQEGYTKASDDYSAGTGDAFGGRMNHTDEIYDISIGSLIDYTNKVGMKSMKLTAAHFVYLKDLGVYPNNRLMIARRFPAPVGNDLTAVTAEPLATLISWVPNDSDFLDISFGEHWDRADASFEKVLNDIGKDTSLSGDNSGGNKGLGSKFYEGFNAVPFGGFTEGLQRDVMKKLGIIDDKDPNVLPEGNPNLIKEGMRRRVIGKGQDGSGLKCNFSVTMKVEYEHKYINGLDSSIAYFDLISNVLSFATSESTFMYNKLYAGGANGILGKLISGDVNAIKDSLQKFITAFADALSQQSKQLVEQLKNSVKSDKKADGSKTPSGLKAIAATLLGSVIGKYKMAILGIISSLTGQASTPWHITIGNPKRPIFTSGDMVMEDVKLKLGPVLGWNDLPSTISIEFTLKNARNLGAQEIMNRLNGGKGRSYVRLKNDFASSNLANDNQSSTDNDFNYSSKLSSQKTNFGNSSVNNNTNRNTNNGTTGNTLDGNGNNTPFI